MRKKLRHVQGEKPGALSFPDQEAITVASLGAACTDRGGGDAAAVPVVEAQQKLMAYKLLVGRRALERRFPFAVRINGGYSPVCPQVEMKTFTVADEESADSDSDEEESGEQNVFNSMLDTFLGWLDYHLSGLENLLVAALAAALDDRKKAAVSIVDRVAQYILSMGDVDFEYPEPPKHEDASGAPSALDPEVMQNQPAHWRKQWPEGNTDQGQRDDEVVLPEGEYRSRKWLQPVPVVEYNTGPLDDDILDSQAHLEHYESDFGLEHGLSKESYQDRGFAILNSNDAAVKSVWL